MENTDLKRLIEKFGHLYNAMIMAGSLIESSSPQCRYAIIQLKGIITIEAWEKELKSIALKNKMKRGATFLDLPFTGLHSKCRHEFVPAILKDGDRIGVNEIFINGKVERI